MEFTRIFECAAEAYDNDGIMYNYFDDETVEVYLNEAGGDTLAGFVALELSDTYDSDATDEEQLEAAGHYIDRALRDLHNVADALNDMKGEL